MALSLTNADEINFRIKVIIKSHYEDYYLEQKPTFLPWNPRSKTQYKLLHIMTLIIPAWSGSIRLESH